MTFGGFTVIAAAVLLAALGWAAAAYSSYQVRQHRAERSSNPPQNEGGNVKAESERVVTIDVVGDFAITARQSESSASPAIYPSIRRKSGLAGTSLAAGPALVKIPRDPETGRILTLDDLPIKHSDINFSSTENRT